MTADEKPTDVSTVVREEIDRKHGAVLLTKQLLGGYGGTRFMWTFPAPARVVAVRVYPWTAHITKIVLDTLTIDNWPAHLRSGFSLVSPADRFQKGERFYIEVAAPSDVQSILEMDLEYLVD